MIFFFDFSRAPTWSQVATTFSMKDWCRRRRRGRSRGRRRSPRSRRAGRCSRRGRHVSASTVASHAANVSMLCHDPHATSSRSGSIWCIARAVSAARRPYSSAVCGRSARARPSRCPTPGGRCRRAPCSPCATRRLRTGRPTRVVGVLLELQGLGDPARAEVDRHHRLGRADLPQEGDVLGQAEAVGLGGAPG